DRPAAHRVADCYSSHQSAAFPYDPLGRDDVLARRQSHVAGLRAAAPDPDSPFPHAGGGRLDLRRQSPARQRLAGARGERASAYDHHSSRPVSQQAPGTVISKLDAGRQQLARTLPMLGSGRWVLIESTSNVARDIESPDALLTLPSA